MGKNITESAFNLSNFKNPSFKMQHGANEPRQSVAKKEHHCKINVKLILSLKIENTLFFT